MASCSRGIFRRTATPFVLLLYICCLSAETAEMKILMKDPPRLSPHGGSVTRVSDVRQLRQAVESAGANRTILVADGEYRLPTFMRLRNSQNVILMGASMDPTKVSISARGWDSRDLQDDILRIENCENITVAYLTFTDCHSYAVKVQAENHPKDIHIYNCHFRDIGVRGIKGSGGRGTALRGSIRYCHFENTKIPPPDWQFGGNYITGIDMMALDEWTISDNSFLNIKGHTGNARAAIFVWVLSKNVTVERNVIVDCDRGVAFGNPSGSTSSVGETEYHMTNGVCRNNFIIPGPDAAIELWWAKACKIYNNTIFCGTGSDRGIRLGSRLANIHVVNNLVNGGGISRGNGTDIVIENNLTGGIPSRYFANPSIGDLRLVTAPTTVVNKGMPLQEITDDFDGYQRIGAPDIGAHEFGAKEVALAKEAAAKESETESYVPAAPEPSAQHLIEGKAEAIASAQALCCEGKSDEAARAFKAIAEELPEGLAADAVNALVEGATLRPALIAIIVSGVAGNGPRRVTVEFAGSPQRMKITAATEAEGLFEFAGMDTDISWSKVSPRYLAGMAAKFAKEPSDHLKVAKFLLACGDYKAAANTLEQAALSGAVEEAEMLALFLSAE